MPAGAAPPDGGGALRRGLSQRASAVTAAMALATMIFPRPAALLAAERHPGDGGHRLLGGAHPAGEFRKIGQIRMMEFRWAVIACLGVLLFGTLEGIVVAILASLLGLASQTAHPRVYVIGPQARGGCAAPAQRAAPR